MVCVFLGNGSASSSVKKKKAKRRKTTERIEAEVSSVPHVSHKYVASNKVDDISQYEETNIDQNLDLDPQPESKPKKGHKYNDVASSQERVDNIPTEQGAIVVDNISESQSQSVRRKKKKKRNRDIADAETNTTQSSVLELIEPKRRPARLDPLPATPIAQAMSTPPLRSKFPRETRDLPPSGDSASRKKHRSHNVEQLAVEGRWC